VAAILPVQWRVLKLLNRATHVVLFMASILGRGFNSRRLHHYIYNIINSLQY